MSQNKFLAAAFGLSLLTFFAPVTSAQNSKDFTPSECFVYVGAYTGGTSKGIYLYRMDMETGVLTSEGLAAETPNPTFFDLTTNGKFLYAADEVNNFQGKHAGSVGAYSVERGTGKLTLLDERSTVGDGPCHILIDHSGKDALIANYGGGSIAVLPIEADGKVDDASTFIQHYGKSINPDRQQKPHAHFITVDPANRFAFVCDLGLDKIMSYRFDAAAGKLTPNDPPFTEIKPGSGPRHLAFSANGRFAYLINEMASTINVFNYDATHGVLAEMQTISTLPVDFKGSSTGAEIAIHPSGKYLYASNRGDDSIAVFAINPANGTLSFIQRQSVQGKTPRYFGIDPTGKYILDANQDSNNLVLFVINPENGQLTFTGKTWELASPVCVKFLPIRPK
jgi:6-phosphogluconolactonase